MLYAQLPAPTVILSRRRRISVHDVSEMYGSKYWSAGSGIPESKRVQVPSAPGFYRSCAAALTDGFRPQSGLVQRKVFEATFRWENRKTAPAARRKNKQTALAGDGNAPLLALTHHFPRRGKFALRLAFMSYGTMNSVHSPTAKRGGKRTRFVGERQRPENRVRHFPVEEGGAAGTKGGARAEARRLPLGS